jgi:hypothetical protein
MLYAHFLRARWTFLIPPLRRPGKSCRLAQHWSEMHLLEGLPCLPSIVASTRAEPSACVPQFGRSQWLNLENHHASDHAANPAGRLYPLR